MMRNESAAALESETEPPNYFYFLCLSAFRLHYFLTHNYPYLFIQFLIIKFSFFVLPQSALGHSWSWSRGVVESWSRGVVESWIRGVVESWSSGVVESHSSRFMELRSPEGQSQGGPSQGYSSQGPSQGFFGTGVPKCES